MYEILLCTKIIHTKYENVYDSSYIQIILQDIFIIF